MGKYLNKILLLVAFVICADNAFAKTTVCYKKNWSQPSTIESTPLDSGECKGRLSVIDMKDNGWKVLDMKVTAGKGDTLTFSYLFKNNKDNLESYKYANNPDASFTVQPVALELQEVNKDTAVIDKGNLIVGSSGIVVHMYNKGKRSIISNAKVIKSDKNSSVVKFFPFSGLKQDALPTTNRKPQNGDIIVLNYMYSNSLVIAPTQDLFLAVRNGFKYNNFMNPDLFAAYLKVENEPFPTRKTIQDYALNQNLGTIFIVASEKVYIVDARTFKILKDYSIEYDVSESMMPFYTRIQDIEESIFSLRRIKKLDVLEVFFTKEEIKKYNEYYLDILGL